MRTQRVWLVGALLALPAVSACTEDTGSQVGEWNEENNVLARMALNALGAQDIVQADGSKVDGRERRCSSSGCHSVSRGEIREWLGLHGQAVKGCMKLSSRRYVYLPRAGDPAAVAAELNPTCETREQLEQSDSGGTPCYFDPASDLMTQDDAIKLIACMREVPEQANSPFDPNKLGVETIRAHERNTHFQRLFMKAYPAAEDWKRELATFVSRAKMPRGAVFEDSIPDDVDPDYKVAVRKEDHWVITEWFDRGLRDPDTFERTLKEVLYEPDERPTTCTPHITQGLKDHIRAMNGQGWTLKNALDGVQMFGCDTDTMPGWPDTSLSCLQSFAEVPEWQATYEGPAAGTKVRVLLKNLGFNTSFWTRSSADGRFVGNGGGTISSATITDLAKSTPGAPFHIPVQANYDPGFMPDNSTFMYQGTRVGAGFCPQDMLLNPPMQNGEMVPITFQESGCAGADNIGTYQHLGTALDGSMSLAAKGQYTSDPGPPTYTTRSPTAAANQNATTEITPIVRSGIGFKFLERTEKPTPFEGDTVVSPTGKLMSFRVGNAANEMIAIHLRIIDMVSQGDSFTLKFAEPDDQWSELCINGAKTSHSFDDRFLTIYSYGANGDGKADVYVFDLYDGEKYQVTNMPKGMYALYAHFRSDGWLYFLINDQNTGEESVAASDIALRLYKSKPIE